MMKKLTKTYTVYFFVLAFFLSACENFVEVAVPDYKITSKTVFTNDQTARSAMNGVYNQLFNTSFANGGNRSVTFLAGLTADNFVLTSTISELVGFNQNNILATNSFNLDLWSGAYTMVYMVNGVLAGIENATSLSKETRNNLEGSAKFVRAFTYFYLTNLYGKVPLLLRTDYQKNATAPRDSQTTIYKQIVRDLKDAVGLLKDNYPAQDRTRPNRYAAMALLARVYLFQEDWEQAKYYSNKVISRASLYGLLEDPNKVFLANSREAIWQISPIGWGNSFTHTREGNLYIKTPTADTPAAFSQSFMNSWGDQDRRRQNWVGSFTDNTGTYYFPYKYKIQYDASGGEITEYSMVLRLAEQYLIRAEARAQSGNLSGAIADIDKIRDRAGIPLIGETQSGATQKQLLEIIVKERRKELFAEWGHRWFDLKRTGHSSILAEKQNSDWQETDVRYPIPADERMKNSNLTQNQGY